MNFNEDNEFTPTLKLLPFGGFEVAALLQQLQNGRNPRDMKDDNTDFPVLNSSVSSGWLRSKIMAG